MSTIEEKMKESDIFWAHASERVLSIANANGITVPHDHHDFELDELLFYVFDYGERNPTDEEILDAMREMFN